MKWPGLAMKMNSKLSNARRRHSDPGLPMVISRQGKRMQERAQLTDGLKSGKSIPRPEPGVLPGPAIEASNQLDVVIDKRETLVIPSPLFQKCGIPDAVIGLIIWVNNQ